MRIFSRGITLSQTLLVIAGLAVCGAVLVAIERATSGPTDQQSDAVRMRHVYMALALYENANEGMPAPNLAATRRDLDDSDFRAANDPFAEVKAKDYPVDPSLVSSGRAPLRIGFSYLPVFVHAGKAKVENWWQTKTDPRIGLIACFYYGNIHPGADPFTASVDGPVVRVNMDGSVTTIPHREKADVIDAQDLFFRR